MTSSPPALFPPLFVARSLASITVRPADAESSYHPGSGVNHGGIPSAFDDSPLGIYRVTADGQLVAVNRALCALVGYELEELMGADVRVLYVDATDCERLIAELEGRDQTNHEDVRWRRRDGSVITTRVWLHADRDETGAIAHLDGYVEDVTAIRATEHALAQAEKLAALGQLVSSVAHELNNPLSAILLFTDDLLTTERSAEDRDALSIIAQQARRSRAIVRDLLSFARSRDVTREQVDVETFFASITRALQPQLVELGVDLHVDIARAAQPLLLDRAGMEQVITNLVINGAQAAGAGGTVQLRARREGHQYVIEVLDDGPGIPDEVLPRIFEPFFTTKPMGQGTGLGLPVSLGVVQQHGGTLIAGNRGCGAAAGAQFVVRLPQRCVIEAPVTPSPPPPIAAPDGTRHVLIVDDESSIRSALARFYSRKGWRVSEAADGAAALRRLIDNRESFDLVLSDVKMPHVSGIELHAALAHARPELLSRLVFCTGEAESGAVASFVESSGCRVLLKPFDLTTLAALSDDIARVATTSEWNRGLG